MKRLIICLVFLLCVASLSAQTRSDWLDVKNKYITTVDEHYADSTGAVDSSAAFDAAFASGNSVMLKPGATYKIKDVVLPKRNGFSFDGNGAKLIPASGATSLFTCEYDLDDPQVTNQSIGNFIVEGAVTNVINFTYDGGVNIYTRIHDIRINPSSTIDAVINLACNNNAQAEGILIDNINCYGSNNTTTTVNHLLKVSGSGSAPGAIQMSNVYHTVDVASSTVYSTLSLINPKFDLIYGIRGAVFETAPGAQVTNGVFTRNQIEPVVSGTRIASGTFAHCTFSNSLVTEIAAPAAVLEDIKLFSGTAISCTFDNQTYVGADGAAATWTYFDLASGSYANKIYDLTDATNDLSNRNYRNWSRIGDLGANTELGLSDRITGKSAFGLQTVRSIELTIANGDAADTITCTSENRWNGNHTSFVQSLPANATSGGYQLNASGTELTLLASGFVDGPPVAVLSVGLVSARGTPDIGIRSYASASGITLIPTTTADGEPWVMTTLGDSEGIKLEMLYLTGE